AEHAPPLPRLVHQGAGAPAARRARGARASTPHLLAARQRRSRAWRCGACALPLANAVWSNPARLPRCGAASTQPETFMKQLISLPLALALAFSTSAFATSHKEAPGMAASGAAMSSQQTKMTECNKEAADKK